MMRRMGSCLSQGLQRLRMADRRTRMGMGVTFITLLLMTTVFRSFTLRLLHLNDICDDLDLPQNSQSPGQPKQDQWWFKLCRIERALRQIDYHCQDNREMGNRQVCFDFKLVPRNNCLVYSFGIDYKFDFDDAMAAYGCTVFSFDPSMNMSDHQRSERVYFKRLGLADKDSDSFVPRLDGYVKHQTTWPMRRLPSIMKELGHSKGSLTIVKIDIENYEWAVMEDLLSEAELLASIPQLLIEWHLFEDSPPRTRYDHFLSLFSNFRSRGFHSFHWNSEGEDHDIDSMETQTETAWLNERFLTSRRSS